MRPLLVHSDVSPLLSIAEKAWSRVGDISSIISWKFFVGTPSQPDALSFSIATMASLISFRVSSFVRSLFASLETLVGVLPQHTSRASEVPGALAFDVYKCA